MKMPDVLNYIKNIFKSSTFKALIKVFLPVILLVGVRVVFAGDVVDFSLNPVNDNIEGHLKTDVGKLLALTGTVLMFVGCATGFNKKTIITGLTLLVLLVTVLVVVDKMFGSG